MTPDEREALVERMAEVISQHDDCDHPDGFRACEPSLCPCRKKALAALAKAEPVVREDERERCIEAIAEYEFPLDIAVDHQAMLDMRVGLDLAAHAIRKGAA